MTIEIQRVVKEISPLQVLEKRVEETAEVVRGWKNTVSQITTERNVATMARDKAKNTRATHALKAAMHDTHAVSEVKAAWAAQTAAEQTLANLAEALPAAEQELAAANKAETSARHALARFEAGCLARERVKAAARIDTLISELSAAFSDFDKLGLQIGNTPGLLPDNPHMAGMSISRTEEIRGDLRVRSALPKVWLRFFPGALHSERPALTLEASERQIWSSLASLDTKAKAA
jgi:hypothetical protein